MTQNGEWGEFFPRRLGSFRYNETNAQAIPPIYALKGVGEHSLLLRFSSRASIVFRLIAILF